MLRRTGFKRQAYTPAPPAPVRPLVRRPSYACNDVTLTIQKDNPLEHEGYRRLVASLPCIRCGIVGWSQCAHGPILGKSIKCDDRFSMPLCADRPLVVGCHTLYDQYRLGRGQWRRDMAVVWSAQTRAEIIAAGLWPVGLPMWEGA